MNHIPHFSYSSAVFPFPLAPHTPTAFTRVPMKAPLIISVSPVSHCTRAVARSILEKHRSHLASLPCRVTSHCTLLLTQLNPSHSTAFELCLPELYRPFPFRSLPWQYTQCPVPLSRPASMPFFVPFALCSTLISKTLLLYQPP